MSSKPFDPAGVPQEPSAAFREVARICREMYVALVGEGFSGQEALAIVAQTLTAHIQKPNNE